MDIAQLDATAAYIKGHPIREASQMPKSLSWKKIDWAWEEAMKSNFWYTGYPHPLEKVFPEAELPHLRKLLAFRDRLLTFGGEQVCLPPIEEDLGKIVARGQLWYGDKLRLMKGAPCHCHSNSAALWAANRKSVLLATGYALSSDGMWRQHSWGILVRPRQNQVVETTSMRIAYFGFVMTPEEAEMFAYENP